MHCARVGERRHQIAMIGRRSFDDRHAADRQADVGIGILGLQETRIQCGQVFHAITMRFARRSAAGSQVPNP